ncbi:hypothetical protein [Massilia sp. CF038]|uniref:hypothetical protein n=1 Tax=Massilia sp. CF038 TaxID=1881045 RepID=UPI00091DE8F5|nr:hypothetical protein [Massilia sp. CF038]SHG46380.1 hypothetical protein SAMN05428948_0597 [Massilia sp. CF038]
MKRLIVLMACAAVLGGCASKRAPMPAWTPVAAAEPAAETQTAAVAAPVAAPGTDTAAQPVEYIPFRAGVSSTTVENMAKQVGCVGGVGAGLTSPPGPVETYRMVCPNRALYTAKCEFRQCVATSVVPQGGYALPAGAMVQQGETADGQPVMVAAEGGVLGAREVPKLNVVWACGNCSQNFKVAGLIQQAYAGAAAARGYRVSAVETAKVSITDYRQRPPAVRVMFGLMAGKDRLAVKTEYRGRVTTFKDSNFSAWVGMNSLADQVGKETFAQLVVPATQ